MTNPLFLIDTWEGGGEIDEPFLVLQDVTGIIVRINDISGGHHMDDNFVSQWQQAKALPVRLVYFVYNPWKNGQENFNWLKANIPAECGAVLADVEVRYTGITTAQYAKDLQDFSNLCKQNWNLMIYTGEGFLDLCTSWPTIDYWWAAYLNEFYPKDPTPMKWDEMKLRFSKYDRPANASKVPGTLKIWQFSGDRLIMDGCTKPMDLNVFYGTLDELKAFANEKPLQSSNGDLITGEKQYFDGLVRRDYEAWTSHGKAIYHLVEVDIDKVDAFFVSPRSLSNRYVPDALEKYGLDFAVNCDGFLSITIAGFAASEGQPYGQTGKEDSIFISQDKVFTTTRQPVLWNAYSYPNLLVKDGKIVPINKALDDIRARTAFGITKDQKKAFFVLVDGADYWVKEGMNFPEVAQILINHGCDFGVMHDSGGSTTGAVNNNGTTEVIGVPYGEDYVAKYDAKLRRVANIFGLRMKTESIPTPPTTGDETMEYEVVTAVKPRKNPSMYETQTLTNLTVGSKFTSTTTRLVDETINGVVYHMTWVQMANLYWVPLDYKGTTYVKETISTPVPTETAWPEYYIMIDPAGNQQKYIKG